MKKALFYLTFLILITSCQTRKDVDFNTQIKPIINKKCISCHGGVKQSAGFSLLFKEEALGQQLIGAIYANDLPTVQTITFMFAVLIVLFNLLADIIYGQFIHRSGNFSQCFRLRD